MTKELTDEQIGNVLPRGMTPYLTLCGPTEIRRFARAVIAADRELQDARHSEELAAYELTISNLRAAHRVPDGWVLAPNEATTEMVLALMGTGLRNTEYKSKAASPSIFEMKQGYIAMLAAAPQTAAQPERNPPDPADIIAGALGTSRAHAYDLMREACAAAQPAAALTDDEIFLAYTAATGKTLPTLGRSRNDLIAISRAVIAAHEAKKGGEA